MTEVVPLSNLIDKMPHTKKYPNLLSYIQKNKIFHIEIPIDFILNHQMNKTSSQTLIPYSVSYVDWPFIIPVVLAPCTFSLNLAVQRCILTTLIIILPSLIVVFLP